MASNATLRPVSGAEVGTGSKSNSRPKASVRASTAATRKAVGAPAKQPPNGSERTGDVQKERPIPRTHLRPDELAEFKELLLAKRRELTGDVLHLSNESSGRNSEAGADHSTMPIHMADLGSDNWEHEFTLGLIANEQTRIREIDEALSRIEDLSYGVCLATHKRIHKARLRAKPWAKYCIDYAKAREEGRV